MKRRILFATITLCGIAGLTYAWLQIFGNHETSGKARVTASVYPVAEFTRQIGGNRVNVTTLVNAGVEPHDFEPRPQDLTGIYRAPMFVYNGAGLEQWAERIHGDVAKNKITVVRATDNMSLLKTSSDANAASDPHVWLDPVRAQQQVRNILEGLIRIDGVNREYYETRAKDYISQLDALDQAYRDGLGQCARHDIVTSHEAFRYVADRYNLQLTSIAGLSPEDEPSPQKMAEVAQYVKDHGVKYIFFETLVSPKLADTLARETGAKTLVFNPLEGLTEEEIRQGKNYISIQKENLQNLRLALDCK